MCCCGEWNIGGLLALLGFGTLKVKEACFNAMFSDCNRDKRSRRFSFSEVAC